MNKSAVGCRSWSSVALLLAAFISSGERSTFAQRPSPEELARQRQERQLRQQQTQQTRPQWVHPSARPVAPASNQPTWPNGRMPPAECPAALQGKPCPKPEFSAPIHILTPAESKESNETFAKERARKEKMEAEAEAEKATKVAAAEAEKRAATDAEKREANNLARDVDQAKAAHVDVTVFGVALGEPLRLPRCPQHSADEICLLDTGERTYVKGVIAIPLALRPRWLVVSSAGFEVQGGVLASFSMRAAQDPSLVSDLTKKFGKAKSQVITFSNAYGKTYRAVELEWNLPGLHAKYSPDGFGDVPSGELDIELATVRHARVLKEQSEDAKRIKL